MAYKTGNETLPASLLLELGDQRKDRIHGIKILRQQIIDLQKRASEFDEMRKAHIVLKEENEGLNKTIEQLEAAAQQIAEVQNRRSIETGNTIDSLKFLSHFS